MEELCRLCPDDHVTMVTSTDYIKGVDNVVHVTKNLDEFEGISSRLCERTVVSQHVFLGIWLAEACLLRENRAGGIYRRLT